MKIYVKDLRKAAKILGLRGYSRWNKMTLVKKIRTELQNYLWEVVPGTPFWMSGRRKGTITNFDFYGGVYYRWIEWIDEAILPTTRITTLNQHFRFMKKASE